MEEKIVIDQEPMREHEEFVSEFPLNTKNLNELYAALAKAQGEMKVARLSSENPYFKTRYADMAELVAAASPALTKYGLSVNFNSDVNSEGQMFLYGTLAHSSGQFTRSKMRLVPVKNDPQALGSLKTYYKRYMYAELTGVVASGDDDDGERAMRDARQEFAKGTKVKPNYEPKNTVETITKEQLDELEYELTGEDNEYADITEMVLKKLDIESLADMPKEIYREAMTSIRKIKAARSGK